MPILLAVSAFAANPFLEARDDKPVSAKFRGTEWSDEIGRDEIPLTARVVTTRIAKMPWGAIFRIEFTDLKSRTEKRREIRPDYFIVTDDRIVLLNEENNEDAAKKISTMDKPPTVEDGDVRGIISPESWIMKRARGRRPSRSKVTYALILPAIIQVIFQRWSGKKELDWLSTPAATARMPTAVGLNASC